MPFELSYINERISADAAGFVAECEAEYHDKVALAARMISENVKKSPLVLLSGPSGSGKTTTAQKVTEALSLLGIKSQSVALDHYFLPRDEARLPVTPEGEPDFESPLCIDWALLNSHFSELDDGREVLIPYFSFVKQARDVSKAKPLRLKKDEIVIFEGIHALNSLITEQHPEAFKLYISARSDTYDGETLVFKGTWKRLVRRVIRDDLFRGADPMATISMWANVRRGEKSYISPFKDTADLKLDTSMPYEVAAMRDIATEIFSKAPNGAERYDELTWLLSSLRLFADFDSTLIPADSVLREFIGGGVYKY